MTVSRPRAAFLATFDGDVADVEAGIAVSVVLVADVDGIGVVGVDDEAERRRRAVEAAEEGQVAGERTAGLDAEVGVVLGRDEVVDVVLVVDELHVDGVQLDRLHEPVDRLDRHGHGRRTEGDAGDPQDGAVGVALLQIQIRLVFG
ncbi:MAG TPA: hypothetical protein VM386_03150 [Acidimicrobiales bacterium]|nr:hypothetical protein [Acidimicrobiales bacterium]